VCVSFGCGYRASTGEQLCANDKRIVLRFTPKENVTANLPGLEGANPAKPIDVRLLVDTRALPDLSSRRREPRAQDAQAGQSDDLAGRICHRRPSPVPK